MSSPNFYNCRKKCRGAAACLPQLVEKVFRQAAQDFSGAGNPSFPLIHVFLPEPGEGASRRKAEALRAVPPNTEKRSAAQRPHSCAAVLDGLQPACILRLALRPLSPPSFFSLFPGTALGRSCAEFLPARPCPGHFSRECRSYRRRALTVGPLPAADGRKALDGGGPPGYTESGEEGEP